MDSSFMRASSRNAGFIQLRKCCSHLKLCRESGFIYSGGSPAGYDKQISSCSRKSCTMKFKQQASCENRKKMAWRIHLRRVGVKLKGFRKRVVRGIEVSRAILFQGATSSAANLVKSNSFFCHINHRFQLMFHSPSHFPGSKN
ncbi:hypothetical protein SUGI_0991460 [Cryptomeria japonica]|nr:hypothetical protein SUGI_0991460 [Cryptomeria japonica]